MTINQTVYYIEGVLKTVTPLHITSATSEARYTPSTGRISIGTEKLPGSFPLSLTQNLRVLFPQTQTQDDALSDSSEDTAQEWTQQETYPIISSSTIRGMLRRGAAQIVEDHLINELGRRPSYEMYQGMNTGAVSDKPDGVPPTTTEIRTARNHVFYGLFGGGPRMLRGSLVVNNALPVIDKLIDADIIPPLYSESALKNVYARALTDVKQVLRKDAFIGSAGEAERASGVVENFDDVYSQKHLEIVERAIGKAKSKESGEEAQLERSGTKAMAFRQDVTVGVPFLFSVAIKGNESQVGMILGALEKMLDKGIGGKASSGFGQLTGTLTVHTRQQTERVPVMTVRSGMVDFLDGAEPYLSAMGEAVTELDYESVASFVTPALKAKKPATKTKAG